VALRALEKYAIGIYSREVTRVAGITVKNCFTALTDFENIGKVTSHTKRFRAYERLF